MASSSSVLTFVVLATLLASVSCKLPNVPPGPDIPAKYGNNWLVAKATWYGKPTGAGGDDNGGGCGYKDVDKPPFSAKTACGNPPIFKDGKGCGSCYEIKCTKPEECSGQAVMIRIADQNEEPIAAYHFDLTGTAFGALAKPGLEQKLRSRGELELQFRRVKCTYPPSTKVTFHVEKGSNTNYLALLIKYVPVDGNAVSVEIQEKGSAQWTPLKPSWGAIWRIDTPKILKGPFSVRYTTEGGTKTIAEDVIPAGWKADTTYVSKISSN